MLVVDSRWLSCLDLSLSSIVQPCWIKPRKSDSAVLGIREEKNSMNRVSRTGVAWYSYQKKYNNIQRKTLESLIIKRDWTNKPPEVNKPQYRLSQWGVYIC